PVSRRRSPLPPPPLRPPSRVGALLRAPPPFPTRRSSDLPTEATFLATFMAHRVYSLTPNTGSIATKMRFSQVFLPTCLLSGQHLDRKSTRLNSSHGSISYSVFCLKKNKTNTLRSRFPTAL